MRNFLFLSLACYASAIVISAAPEGLSNRILPPHQQQQQTFNGYPQHQQPPQQQQQQFKYLPPCQHNHGNSGGVSAALIQSQSQGRIVNNAKLNGEQSQISVQNVQSPGNIGIHQAHSQFQQNTQFQQQQFQQQALPLQGQAPQHLHLHYNVPNNKPAIAQAPPLPIPFPANQQQYAASHQGHQQSYTSTASNFGGVQQQQLNAVPIPSANVDSFTPIVNNVNVNTNSGFATNYAHNSQQQFQQNLNLNAGSIVSAQPSSSSESSSLQDLNAHLFDNQLSHVIRETFESTAIDPTAEKHIYVHVPPEDLESNQEKHNQQTLPPAQIRKHYKIIFIKAPTVGVPNYAQLQQAAAAQQAEEKTLIYVLVKKPDQPSIEEIQQLQQANIKINKPEVYFIKYKAKKENDGYNAPATDSYQQSIETQNYDLGTTTSLANEGPDAIDIRLGNNIAPSSESLHGGYPDNGNPHSAYDVPLN